MLFNIILTTLAFLTIAAMGAIYDNTERLPNDLTAGMSNKKIAELRGTRYWFHHPRSDNANNDSSDRKFPEIHWINSTTVHESPVIDGKWQISNVSVPADWLCIKLSTPKAADGSQQYACMPQVEFARQYEASLRHPDQLSTTAIMTIVLCAMIYTVFVGFLVRFIVVSAAKRYHGKAAEVTEGKDAETSSVDSGLDDQYGTLPTKAK